MKVREKTHENIKSSWVYDQEKLICCYEFRHGEKCLFCDKREHLLKWKKESVGSTTTRVFCLLIETVNTEIG